MKRSVTMIVMVGLVLFMLALVACNVGDPELRSQVLSPPVSPVGFARVEGPETLRFPADHGPHPDYQTEWWYLTGNLDTAEGRHFGYQLTFFRRALVPPAERAARESDWATDQVYMAHLALSDVAGGRFQAEERFARGAAGLADAQADPFAVWLENWRLEAIAADQFHLYAANADLSLDLQLTDLKEPVLQGDEGYSRKGPDAGNASSYYSMSRLETVGTVAVADRAYTVNGLSWMDHEYSTSALSVGQVGWDWFSLQLDDGSELMVFQIRRHDGSVDPYSSGMLMPANGAPLSLKRNDFEIQVLDRWRSPQTGALYPARWRVKVPAADLDLLLEPYLADQELNLSYAYWEGAVRITGQMLDRSVQGSGYVEMTGYAASMSGQF